MLNVINLDAVVVRTNVARAQEGAELDAGYLASLSADAVPSLASVLPELPDEPACVVLEALVPDEEPDEHRNWRSWNLARAREREEAAARVARCGVGERHPENR